MGNKKFNFIEDSELLRETERAVNDNTPAATIQAEPYDTAQAPTIREQSRYDKGGKSELKGVQAYITMDMYRRLYDRKIQTRQNIGTLVADAIEYWLNNSQCIVHNS